jgi:uncharacterized membrane protein (UPF0127 family)
MKSAKTPLLIIGLIIMLAVLGAALLFSQSFIEEVTNTETRTLADKEHVEVVLGELPLRVVIADTAATRHKGLSGIEELADDEGMLFVFDRPDILGFWMKGMKIPLDLMWFDGNGSLIHIEENLAPDTYPESFAAPDPAMYVLEMNAGFVEEYGIQEGAELVFDEI